MAWQTGLPQRFEGQTSVLRESATESATDSSPVMPVRDGMLDQHLCKVMPVMQPRLGAQAFMQRGATKSWGAHARGTSARKHLKVVPTAHTPTEWVE